MTWLAVFSSTVPGASRMGGKAQKEREEVGHFIIFKTEFISRRVCISYPRPGSSPQLLLQRSSYQIDLAQRWCSSTEHILGILGATEYLKGMGFHEENTKEKKKTRIKHFTL